MTNNTPENTASAACIGCEVRNCKFHDRVGDCCTAAHITVENKSAVSKGETFCGTFIPRGSF
ncbi:MAG: DUF1540 domain-containing protein [Oscillospiraceae bacterium]|nr:DUF1540 domain-containing protein [Oscillospiraceae bacterium]